MHTGWLTRDTLPIMGKQRARGGRWEEGNRALFYLSIKGTLFIKGEALPTIFAHQRMIE